MPKVPCSEDSRPLCALCRNGRDLRNSHVIPEFIYTPLYDDKHRFHVLSAGDQPHRYGQKGLRERLLCGACEEKFSKHEKYVSDVLTGRVQVNSKRVGRQLVQITGVDYSRFKLFSLSVLWRAGVSSLPMFVKVTLGPHESQLRAQLLQDDPGPSTRYGVFLAALVDGEEKDLKSLIVQPTRSRLDGHLCLRFVFGGLIWVFVVSSHQPPAVFRNACVNERGELLMLISRFSDVTFVANAVREIFGSQQQ